MLLTGDINKYDRVNITPDRLTIVYIMLHHNNVYPLAGVGERSRIAHIWNALVSSPKSVICENPREATYACDINDMRPSYVPWIFTITDCMSGSNLLVRYELIKCTLYC